MMHEHAVRCGALQGHPVHSYEGLARCNMMRQLIRSCACAMMQSSDRPPTCCSISVADTTWLCSSKDSCMAGLHGPRLSLAWSTSLMPHGARRSSSSPERRLQTTSRDPWSCCCRPARSSSPTAKALRTWMLSWTALHPHAGEIPQIIPAEIFNAAVMPLASSGQSCFCTTASSGRVALE